MSSEYGFDRFHLGEERASRITLKSSTPKYSMKVNTDRCIGCMSCEVSCKKEHNLPVGPRRMRVIQVGPYFVKKGQLKTVYLPMNCFHCDDAACVKACPTGSMQKRADGIVFNDPNTCIGCKSCIHACPFGSPQFNEATGKVTKCDYCKHRIDEGLLPACVTLCSTDALWFGNINRISTIDREKTARKLTEHLFGFITPHTPLGTSSANDTENSVKVG
ncbi:MAG: 4Fe-4S dicluster domain-containing protein [bacterium]